MHFCSFCSAAESVANPRLTAQIAQIEWFVDRVDPAQPLLSTGGFWGVHETGRPGSAGLSDLPSGLKCCTTSTPHRVVEFPVEPKASRMRSDLKLLHCRRSAREKSESSEPFFGEMRLQRWGACKHVTMTEAFPAEALKTVQATTKHG